MPKLSSCLILALVGAVLLAGCGGSSKTTSSGASTSDQSAAETTSGGSSTSSKSGGGSTSSGTSTGTHGSAGTAPNNASSQNPQQVCERIVQAPSQLSASAKARLIKACSKAGGGRAAQHLVVRELCSALAERLPAGSQRTRAQALCSKQ